MVNIRIWCCRMLIYLAPVRLYGLICSRKVINSLLYLSIRDVLINYFFDPDTSEIRAAVKNSLEAMIRKKILRSLYSE